MKAAFVLALAVVALMAPSVWSVSVEDFDENPHHKAMRRASDGATVNWGYETDLEHNIYGPELWGQLEGSVCGSGKATERQTPIDVKDARFDAALVQYPLHIEIGRAGPNVGKTVTNNGHSVQIDFDVTTSPVVGTLTGGPLVGEPRRLRQLHFHWGQEETPAAAAVHGSEHAIKGKFAAAELHLVHWNTKYATVTDAADKSDGLSVVGILIDEGEQENWVFSELGNRLAELVAVGNKVSINDADIDLSVLLPANTKDYYTYGGSLTTPPCYESVTWVLLKERITMTSRTLNLLRAVLNNEGVTGHNFRPIQPINGRDVRQSFETTDMDNWREAYNEWQGAFAEWKASAGSCGNQ